MHLAPSFPPGPRTPENLRAHLRSLANAAAQEAGLNDSGAILTLALQAAYLKRPWRGVDYELACAAAALRDLAERPMSLAVPAKE